MSTTWREKLQQVMDDRGLSQYKLAEATGIRQPRISAWLAGKGEPGLDQWGVLCRALDVPLSTFLPEHLADDVPDYRTDDERMFVRAARKVGLPDLLVFIMDAAVHGRGGRPEAKAEPAPGPIKPFRTITRRAEDTPGEPKAGGPGERGDSRKGPKRRK